MLELIIDDRERALFPHIELELTDIKYTIARCTVGDYAVTYDNTLLAIFERKTYEDFASSIKDGRHANKQKLMKMREETHCQVYYIIEGKAFPNNDESFNRFPYTIIESAIDHLIIRDRIHILYTRDKQHTITRLSRFIKSMESLYKSGELILNESSRSVYLQDVDISKVDISKVDVLKVETPLIEKQSELCSEVTHELRSVPVMELLTAKVETADIDIVRSIWAKIKGISTISADMFIGKYAIAEIIHQTIISADLKYIKYSNGRTISKKIIESITNITDIDEAKMLGAVPGISLATAKEIIQQCRLSKLLNDECSLANNICVGVKQHKLGDVRAKRILYYFNWRPSLQKEEDANIPIT